MSTFTAPKLVLGPHRLLRVRRSETTFIAFRDVCLEAREFMYSESVFEATSTAGGSSATSSSTSSSSSSSSASPTATDSATGSGSVDVQWQNPTHRVLLRAQPERAPKNAKNVRKQTTFWSFDEAVSDESHADLQQMVPFPVQVYFSEESFLVDLKYHYDRGAIFWQRNVPASSSHASRSLIGNKRSFASSGASEDPDFDVDIGGTAEFDSHADDDIDDDDDSEDAFDQLDLLLSSQSNSRMSSIFSSHATLVAVSSSKDFSLWCVPDVRLRVDKRIRRCPGQAVFCGQFKGVSWCECDRSNLRFRDINLADSVEVDKMFEFSSKDGVFCVHQHHLTNNWLSIDFRDTTQIEKLEIPMQSCNISFASQLDQKNESMHAVFSPTFLGGCETIGCIDSSGFCRSCRKKSCQHSMAGKYSAASSIKMIDHPSISEHFQPGLDGILHFNHRNNVDADAVRDFKEQSKLPWPGRGAGLRIGYMCDMTCACGSDLNPIPTPPQPHAGPVYILHDTVAFEEVYLYNLKCSGCGKIFDAPYEHEGLWRLNANTFLSIMLMYSIDSFRSKGHSLPISAFAEAKAILYEASGCEGAAARIRQHRSLLHGSYLQFAMLFHPKDFADGIRCVCPGGVRRVGVDGVAYAPPPKQGSFSPLLRDHQRQQNAFSAMETSERFIINWKGEHKAVRELLTKYFCRRINAGDMAALTTTLSSAGAHEKLKCWSFLVTAPCLLPGSETKPRNSVEYLMSGLLSFSPMTTLIHSDAVPAIDAIITSQGLLASTSDTMKILSKHAPRFWGVLKEIESAQQVTQDFCASFRTLLSVCLTVRQNWLPGVTPNYNANPQQLVNDPIREFYEYGHYFPSHPIVRGLGHYAVDGKRSDASIIPSSCMKEPTPVTRTTRVLLPFICLDCEQCFGLSCIDAYESPRAVFDVLFMRFVRPPRCVFYDNACHLSVYCALREPWFFKDMDFTVDRFHAANHKQDVCSTAHNAYLQPQYNDYNSQLMEQLNSRFDQLSEALRFCSPGSYLVTLVIALFKDNRDRAANLRRCPKYRLRTSRAAQLGNADEDQ
jgi:hypothetical protein